MSQVLSFHTLETLERDGFTGLSRVDRFPSDAGYEVIAQILVVILQFKYAVAVDILQGILTHIFNSE